MRVISRAVELAKRKRLIAALVAVCLFASAAVAADSFADVRRLDTFTRTVAEASAAPAFGEATEVSWSFRFLGEPTTVSAQIDPGELAAAQPVDLAPAFASEGSARSLYLGRTVRLLAESAFIASLAEEFRSIARSRSLDSDEYVELLVRGVQAIPYGGSVRYVRMPVASLADLEGVCSEKSLLLGALLVREGYDSVLWVFDTQGHAAVGVRGDVAGFRDSGYLFCETTRPKVFGLAEDTFWASGPVMKPPQTIRLGGSRRYSAGEQVEYVLAVRHAARRAKWMELRHAAKILPASTSIGSRALAFAEAQHDAARVLAYIDMHADERAVVYERLSRSHYSFMPEQ